MTTFDERTPPSDLDAEEAVLGSCLIDGEAPSQIIGYLEPGHFYRDKNSWIYETIMRLYGNHEPVNQVSVGHELKKQDRLEAIGGVGYLSNLIQNCPTSVHVKYYADKVYQLAAARELIMVGGKVADIGYSAPALISEAVGKAESELASVRFRYSQDEEFTTYHGQGMLDYLETVEHASDKPWLVTPWDSFNQMVRMRNGTVTTIAGPSSMGKTILAQQVCDYIAAELGYNVLYMHNELEQSQLQHRRTCRYATLPDGKSPSYRKLEDGEYAGQEWLQEYAMEVANWPGQVTFVKCEGWPVHRICAEIRQKASVGLADAVFVDYLQLIPRESVGAKNTLDTRRIGIIVTMLKQTCQSLPNKPPLILISQVNRTLREKGDCNLNALRDSGEVGEYSNVVTFIFNEWDAMKGACINECNRGRGTQMPGQCYRRCTYLVTVKNTFGPCGEVLLRQIPHRYQFVDGG